MNPEVVKWGRRLGWFVTILLIVLIILGGVGLVYLSTHPCYHGALNATKSHLMALSMASGCSHTVGPSPPKMMDLSKPTEHHHHHQVSSGGSKRKSFAGLILTIVLGLSVVLIGGGIAFVRARNALAADLAAQMDDLGDALSLGSDMSGVKITAEKAEEMAPLTARNGEGVDDLRKKLQETRENTEITTVEEQDQATQAVNQAAIQAKGLKNSFQEEVKSVDKTESNESIPDSLADNASGVINAVGAVTEGMAEQPREWYDNTVDFLAGEAI